MSWSFSHPDFGLTFRLDEHGGEKEERHRKLYDECVSRMERAIAEIAADPAYSEIVLEYCHPEASDG
jgi:hypothetical protein